MNMRIIPTSLLAGLLSTGAAFSAEDHEPAPMMAPADAPMTEDAFSKTGEPPGRTRSPEAILSDFRNRFDDGEAPRFAVFWNHRLPARVSDWRSQRRTTLGISGEASGTAGGDPIDIESRVALSGQAEYRSDRDKEQAAQTAFALQSGLIGTFRNGNATVIDQALAKRITDNALEDGTFSRLSPDQMRLQMRALAEHADYVLELTNGPRFNDDETYQVRVLSVEDATVVTLFSSTGKPPKSDDDGTWVATDSGYEKKSRPLSLKTVGRELALQTMEHMTQ